MMLFANLSVGQDANIPWFSFRVLTKLVPLAATRKLSSSNHSSEVLKPEWWA
jgi:hypothetical protein